MYTNITTPTQQTVSPVLYPEELEYGKAPDIIKFSSVVFGLYALIYQTIGKIWFEYKHIKIEEKGSKSQYAKIDNLRELGISKKSIKNVKLEDRNNFLHHCTVVKQSLTDLKGLPAKVQEIFTKNIDNIAKGTSIKSSDGNESYIAHYGKDHKLQVIKLGKEIASGSFSSVYEATLINDLSKKCIFKTPKDNSPAGLKTAKQQTSEQSLVFERFSKQTAGTSGVQEAPILTMSGHDFFGTLETRYDSDLDTWVRNQSVPSRLKQNKKDQEALASCINRLEKASEVLTSLMVWWEEGKPHADIKLENMCLDGKKVKLIDLPTDTQQKGNLTHTRENMGVQDLINAKYYKNNKMYAENFMKSDVFNTGVLLFHLLTGQPAFNKNRKYQMRQHIIALIKNPVEQFGLNTNYLKNSGYSEKVIMLIQNMTHPNPKKRLTISEMKEAKSIILGELTLMQGLIQEMKEKEGKEVTEAESKVADSEKQPLQTSENINLMSPERRQQTLEDFIK